MPCFVAKTPPPSQADYETFKSLGYTGTYEQYLELKKNTYDPNTTMFICGSMEGFEHCNHTDCIGFNEFLCDYPIGDDKTCDYGMCEEHSHQIGEDLHYCKTHYEMWLQQKPNEVHVEETAIGFLVDQVFYSLDQEWIAKNKSKLLNKPLVRIFAEKNEL